MGQTIILKHRTVLDDVAMFDMNRSLNGQAGEHFSSVADTEVSTTFPAMLARRLFEAVDAVDHVFVAGSVASVRSKGGWTDEALDAAEFELRNFFVHWAENKA
jgi:hypothetical protein